MTTTYNPGNPFMDTFVDQRRQKKLAELAETNPAIKQQLVENSEKDLIPNAIKWIKSRPPLKKIYDSLNESEKQQMISNLIKTWEIHNNTTQPTNGSRYGYGGKRKTKKQRKHRKAGKSKKQRKTKTKTRKHRKAGKSKKQRKTKK